MLSLRYELRAIWLQCEPAFFTIAGWPARRPGAFGLLQRLIFVKKWWAMLPRSRCDVNNQVIKDCH